MPGEPASHDVVIIGGGPGGYAAALYGAAAGLDVALIEQDKVGGTCLHRGCIPAKEFLETAAVWRTVNDAAAFGIESPAATIDFSVSQGRKAGVVDLLFKGLAGTLKNRSVTVLDGTGQLEADHLVRVTGGQDDGAVLRGASVILAAGSVPRTLPGLEVDGTLVVTSDEFLALDHLPSSAAVIGGGAIGCEFASMLSDLGVTVTIVEGLDSILASCDADVISAVARSFKKRKIAMVTGATVTGHTPTADGSSTTLAIEGQDPLGVEMVVVSVGRRPRTEGLIADGVEVVIDGHDQSDLGRVVNGLQHLLDMAIPEMTEFIHFLAVGVAAADQEGLGGDAGHEHIGLDQADAVGFPGDAAIDLKIVVGAVHAVEPHDADEGEQGQNDAEAGINLVGNLDVG